MESIKSSIRQAAPAAWRRASVGNTHTFAHSPIYCHWFSFFRFSFFLCSVFSYFQFCSSPCLSHHARLLKAISSFLCRHTPCPQFPIVWFSSVIFQILMRDVLEIYSVPCIIWEPHKMGPKTMHEIAAAMAYCILRRYLMKIGALNNKMIEIHIHIFVFLTNRIRRIVPASSCQSSSESWHTTLNKKEHRNTQNDRSQTNIHAYLCIAIINRIMFQIECFTCHHTEWHYAFLVHT